MDTRPGEFLRQVGVAGIGLRNAGGSELLNWDQVVLITRDGFVTLAIFAAKSRIEILAISVASSLSLLRISPKGCLS